MRSIAAFLLTAGALVVAAAPPRRPATVVKPTVLTIVVGKHGVAGGPKKFTVKKGTRVVLRVHSAIGEAVHLHGYDIEKPVKSKTASRADRVHGEGDRRLRDRAPPDGDARASESAC